ncbi:hypothetical protein [Rossellomorea yichunensis]|nr:hypothetical protein [Rossellomorea sp. YC4-1]
MAKSFGTIALSNELARKSFQNAKLIWLTPLLKEDEVFQAMLGSEQEGLYIIGDADRHYEEARFNELKSNHRLHMHLIKGANHSLEHDFHVLDSISIHKQILTNIKAFIEAQPRLRFYSFVSVLLHQVSCLALFSIIAKIG